MERAHHRHLLIVGVLLFVYSLAGWYFWSVEKATYDPTYGFPIVNGGDSESYAFLAGNMLENGVFSSSKEAPFVAEMFRSPGYPAFLVPFLFAFDSFIPVVFVQVILVILSALLVYAIGRSLYSEKIALGTALVFALNPAIIFYTFTILSDILFLFLFLAAIYLLFFRTHTSPYSTYLSIALGALILGYAILVRPAGLYSVWIILPFIVLWYASKTGIKKALVCALVFGIFSLSALVPWYLRNYSHSGSAALSSIGPYTLLFYNVAGFLGSKEGRGADDMKEEIREAEFPQVTRDDLQSGRYTKEINHVAARYIQEDPVNYALYHSLGSINFFLASSFKDVSNESAQFRGLLLSTSFLGEDQVSLRERLNTGLLKGAFSIVMLEPLFSLERLWWLLVSLFAGMAPLLFWRNQDSRLVMLFFFFLVGYFALIFGPVSYPRYRIASEPFLLLLAAGTLSVMIPYVRQKFSGTFSRT